MFAWPGFAELDSFPFGRTNFLKTVKRETPVQESAGEISVSLKDTMNCEIIKQDRRADVRTHL